MVPLPILVLCISYLVVLEKLTGWFLSWDFFPRKFDAAEAVDLPDVLGHHLKRTTEGAACVHICIVPEIPISYRCAVSGLSLPPGLKMDIAFLVTMHPFWAHLWQDPSKRPLKKQQVNATGTLPWFCVFVTRLGLYGGIVHLAS